MSASLGQSLFDDVASTDFLGFSFNGRAYADQLVAATQKTGELCAVRCHSREVAGHEVIWVKHDFGFLGGSLGCAEGEKICRAFEKATADGLPIIVECMTGGARMQEGVMSLMQMAKVSVAVEAQRRAGLPFVSVLADPTYGGVSASYAMQADVRIGVAKARIGFAGPDVILNTMFETNQAEYDKACPNVFQSSEYVQANGQLDIVVSLPKLAPTSTAVSANVKRALTANSLSSLPNRLPAPNTVTLKASEEKRAIMEQTALAVDQAVASVLNVLSGGKPAGTASAAAEPSQAEKDKAPDYTLSRSINRPQAQDIMETVFDNFVELKGDGKVATDPCIRGGLARLGDWKCVVIGTGKGHSPGDMQSANYGMPSPAGYRTALRLYALAERFSLPVVTLVDTVGAWPSFEAENTGQSEAIATNLTAMASLKVPMVTLVIGEGGSGGALGLAMGNRIAMMSQAYYGVISPEGAASILGRYRDEAHKATQFPLDCRELATAQHIYAHQLKELGVIDHIIVEPLTQDGASEVFTDFPVLSERIKSFVTTSLAELQGFDADQIVGDRYAKFRAMGKFESLDPEQRMMKIKQRREAPSAASARRRKPSTAETASRTVEYIANEIISGTHSKYKGLAPAGVPADPPPPLALTPTAPLDARPANAKSILDSQGPEAMAAWVRAQTKVLITDTSMRDAHQSLLATRVRTEDLLSVAEEAAGVLHDAFSFECWGGATFDVCHRFLHESPWERLQRIRAAVPNVCTQMLIRGANAVGYTSYPDNVVEEFVRLAAKNGMDVFRIFDCFNDISNMQVTIKAVRKANKVAEVCVCYTGDILTDPIYNAAYYTDVAKRATEAGAHMIAIKDMAGLLKTNGAAALVAALREGTSLPLHFHTHSTSGGAFATALEMARVGCDVVDVCTASMADSTSQPSMNALCAALVGTEQDTGIDYLALEPLDMHWARIRELYAPFEASCSCSARVYDHQIPGGQYSNLLVQCKSMGLRDRWGEVVDMYRDVNKLLGDVVKVTPSSKSIGDFALYLINRNIKAEDVVGLADTIDFPESVTALAAGRLGFPHRGFPAEVQKAILKGAEPLPFGVRSSASLPPADFDAERARLVAQYDREISDEEVNASLLYPKVFGNFLDYQEKYGKAITHLPTPAFWYGMDVGQTVRIALPRDRAEAEFAYVAVTADGGDAPADAEVEVTITLNRIGPITHNSMRKLDFTVVAGETTSNQSIRLKDADASDEFTGPMADGSPGAVGSPMPGLVEKVVVAKGQTVEPGDVLMIVSAMKMEVQVKAQFAGTVSSVIVSVGDKVVEGALLANMVEA